MPAIKTIIADDEAHLRVHLKELLLTAWPEASVVAEAADGDATLSVIAEHRPEVLFLDIRMPGLSGIEVARRIAGTCHIVFVTAYDQYAVSAFEAEAVDYLLKPVMADRLTQTVDRLRQRLSVTDPSTAMQAAIERLSRQFASAETAPLSWLRVQKGEDLRMVAVDDVAYFQAQDKYTRVVTTESEYLIRTPIKQLAAQLDQAQFWQIHRSTIINVSRIDRVSRSLTGRPVVRLTAPPQSLTASRAYAHLFKGM